MLIEIFLVSYSFIIIFASISLLLKYKSFSNPVFFIFLYLLMYLMLSLIIGLIFDDNYQISLLPSIWYLLTLIFLLLGSIFVRKRRPLFKFLVSKVKIKAFAYYFLYLSFFSNILFFVFNSIPFTVFLNFGQLQTINSYFAYTRYNSPDIDLFYRIFLQIDSTLTYVTALMGGLIINLNKKKLLNSFLFLLPSIIKVLLTNAKQVLLASFLLLIVGFVLSLYLFRSKLNMKFSKFFGLSFAFISIIPMIFIITIFLRNPSSSFYTSFFSLLNYGFGGYFGFDNFFVQFNSSNSLGFGTFNVFYNIIRILFTETNASFSETIRLQNSIWRTNIIMMHGQLYSDFGFLGGLFFIFILGYIFSSSLQHLKYKNYSGISAFFFSIILFFFLHSPFGSIFNYLSLITPFILLSISIFFSKKGVSHE